MAWDEIADRIFTRRYAFFDQQIGVVLSGPDVLVVDTRSTPAQAREIATDLRGLTRQPVSVVIDSHWHFDHSFGNSIFRPATIWGHARTVDRMLERGRATIERIAAGIPEIAADIREVAIDPPDRTFDERTSIELADRVVELRYLGRAHTDTDVVMTVPDADVLFAGDLVEGQAPPSFGDSYPIEWPGVVERMLELVTGPVVPGHGDVAGRAFVEEQLAGFRALAELAQAVHSGTLDLAAAIEDAPFEAPAEVARQALGRALGQLRGELD
jgi:glyoxylase-like metal-dependent hydrolase (beta-lactamase superfamily II)